MKLVYTTLLLALTLMGTQATADTTVIKLYPKQNPIIDPNCDLYTEMVLTMEGSGAKATLRNMVSGTCEIAVTADVRTYELVLSQESCGSLLFEPAKSDTLPSLSILDHRFNMCDPTIKTHLVVKEQRLDRMQWLYSAD